MRTRGTADDRDLLRLLIDSQTEYAIFLLDVDGRVASWNLGAQRIKGYSADDIIGSHFSRFYTPQDVARKRPQTVLERASRDGRYEEEGWRVRKDGTRFWANVVVTALRDDDAELVGYAKVTRDLTQRRANDEALKRTSAELAAATARLEKSERAARVEAERQGARAAALETVGRAIVARVELDEIVQTATDAATEITGADFGAFFYNVEDDAGESYMLYTISGVEREAFSRFPMPRKTEIFGPTFDGEGVVRSDDITLDPRYGRSAPHHGMPAGHLPVRSYLAVPVLTDDGGVAGGLFFGAAEAGVFSADAEAAALSIAATAAVAISNSRLLDAARRETRARQAALEERDRVAKALQESLLPPELPEIPGLELAAHYEAGTELVGGDFYDVFSLGDGRWGVAIGDVCGNGPEAASHTALTRHSIRTAAMFDSDPAHVLQALNTALMRSASDRFATATFARIEPDAAGFRVCVAAGGHPPALVRRTDGTVDESTAAGPLLGVFENVEIQQAEVLLRAGDALVLYTDGLIEARRGRALFGIGGAARALAELDGDARDVSTRMVAAARDHADRPITDDMAILVLRVRGSAGA